MYVCCISEGTQTTASTIQASTINHGDPSDLSLSSSSDPTSNPTFTEQLTSENLPSTKMQNKDEPGTKELIQLTNPTISSRKQDTTEPQAPMFTSSIIKLMTSDAMTKGVEDGHATLAKMSITETIPAQTIPPEIKPTETIPPETMPPETMPRETIPPKTIPPQTMPPETTPQETILPGTIYGETIPAETMPAETMPAETMPAETMPAETMPAETMPAETMPAETMPAETMPAETMPAETIPTGKL